MNGLLTIDADSKSVEAVEAIISEGRSRHSSVGGPYRGGRGGTSFPIYNLVSTPDERSETYARSLIFHGHGHAPLEVTGNMGRLKSHLHSGVSIGDVGFLDPVGKFDAYFNIFDESNMGIQSKSVPMKFKPITPPLSSSEVSRSQIAPGTAIVGKGIDVTRVSEDPLEICFTSAAREGGILVLPDGASREDWISSDRSRNYIKEHIVDWYQFFNQYADCLVIPNGTLCLVTGCDKAEAWGSAVIPKLSELAGRDVSSLTFKDGDWSHINGAMYAASPPTPSRDQGSVFVRGIYVALNEKYWAQHLTTAPRDEACYYNILTTPIIGWRARLLTRKEKYFKPRSRGDIEDQTWIPFHPSNMLLQILLKVAPSAQIAMVDDSVWSSVADGSEGSLPEIKRLTKKVFQLYSFHQENDIVTLAPKPQESVPASSSLKDKPFRVIRPFLLGRKKSPEEIAWNEASKFFSSLR